MVWLVCRFIWVMKMGWGLKAWMGYMLQIYYLARGRQFVSAYALSMLSVANHILIIIKFHNLCMHDIIFHMLNTPFLVHVAYILFVLILRHL